jgi:hypothetical protein
LQSYVPASVSASFWDILHDNVMNGKYIGINGMKSDEWFGDMKGL